MSTMSRPTRLMVVTDLDFTLVDHYDQDNLSLLRFNALWEAYYRHDSLLVFSTGRSQPIYKELRKEKPMLTPDIAVLSVGTEIFYGDAMLPDDDWAHGLDNNWDRGKIVEEASKLTYLNFQPPKEQGTHKVSFYVGKEQAQEAITLLSDRLAYHGLDVKFVYSWGEALDILPQRAGKGKALEYLIEKFMIEGQLPENILVCGDSGNDAELFNVADVYGVMVSNAQEELLKWHEENAKDNPKIFHATEKCAGGIIQALCHFDLGPTISPRDVVIFLESYPSGCTPGQKLVEFYCQYERWCRADCEESDMHLQNIRNKFNPNGTFIHPQGYEQSFSEALEVLSYGFMRGTGFQLWVDSLSCTQLDSKTWLAKFIKWELLEGEKRGCLATAILQYQAGSSETFVCVHLQQKWLEGTPSNTDGWIF